METSKKNHRTEMDNTAFLAKFGRVMKLTLYIKNHYWLIGLSVLTGIFNKTLPVLSAALVAYVVGTAASGATAETIIGYLVVLGIVVLLRALFEYLEMYIAHAAAFRMLHDFRMMIYRKLEQLCPAYMIDKKSGAVTSTVMDDVEQLEWFYAHTLGTFFIAVLVPAAILIYMLSLHWLLPLVLIPWMVLTAVTHLWFRKKADTQGREVKESLAEVNAETIDGVQGLREIISFGQQSPYLSRLVGKTKRLNEAQVKDGKRLGLEQALIKTFTALGMLSVLIVSSQMASSGVIHESLYPVAVILTVYAFNPLLELMEMITNFGLISASADRVFSILEASPAAVDRVTESPARFSLPHIDYQKVSFRYQEKLPLVLDKISFEVKPGETVALVGHSGAGKSTCISLLLRFWEVTGGSISIDGVDLRDMPQKALRETISLVSQDVYLFNTTIRENISLGLPAAGDKDIEKAARAALAHDFIMEMPDGYDTIVGERGAQLSGGQRQRIAIARAFLKNSPILLMDEAVSNLDTTNEQLLQIAIKNLQKNRTTLIIAHRLSTIMSADRIVVLDNGYVAESGSHQELIAKDGIYARLVAIQASA
ncbi:ABC transporter ATP-binding protein [Desulfosporosinus youngiae]|uniref:ABC-type multidrug transport system, ATPase and permease component n=1 Tax=Desulfosporosinus youngiae DSM 17734 TaxID=768710 RepID=H5XXA0_9FIRM|nr:ABC transporter ATP-binding protein [Desulfosporosinus youngiae]EHQ91040.1 ABC-type multidrug transport system, ATPase and permease component [Desulfosporosinus youngiae DSM 17734]